MSKLLSIDQSFTHTAWTVWDDKSLIKFGVLSSDKTQSKYQRADYLALELCRIVKENQIEKVIIEQIAFGGVGNAAKDLAGLLYAIILYFHHFTELKFNDVTFVTPTSAKKVHTGSGKASKQDMLDNVPEKTRLVLSSKYNKTHGLYDLADSYAFAQWYFNQEK